MVDRAGVSVNQASGGGGEGGIRTPDGFPRTAFPVRRHRPLGDLSGTSLGASDGPGNGGEGGIRTHGAHRTPLFESGTLNHSDTSPRRRVYQRVRLSGNRASQGGSPVGRGGSAEVRRRRPFLPRGVGLPLRAPRR